MATKRMLEQADTVAFRRTWSSRKQGLPASDTERADALLHIARGRREMLTEHQDRHSAMLLDIRPWPERPERVNLSPRLLDDDHQHLRRR